MEWLAPLVELEEQGFIDVTSIKLIFDHSIRLDFTPKDKVFRDPIIRFLSNKRIAADSFTVLGASPDKRDAIEAAILLRNK